MKASQFAVINDLLGQVKGTEQGQTILKQGRQGVAESGRFQLPDQVAKEGQA
jgi:hypothetical protein